MNIISDITLDKINKTESALNTKELNPFPEFFKEFQNDRKIFEIINPYLSVNWSKILDTYFVITNKMISSNYCLEKYFISDLEDNDSFFNIFYIPQNLERDLKRQISPFLLKIYNVRELASSPRILLDFYRKIIEMSDNEKSFNPSEFIADELYAHKYLYNEGFPPTYRSGIIEFDEEDNKEYELEDSFKFFQFLDNIRYFTREGLPSYLEKNNLSKAFDHILISAKLNLDHILIEVRSNDQNYLKMMANLPYPYSRVFYSPIDEVLFINAGILGSFKTSIESLESENVKIYTILKRNRYNKISQMYDFENNCFKKIRIKEIEIF
ncbi:MAG: hypothetical protein EU551_02050 [Promethearchaeota archaeon]|nr:MAG: hypothetical protein EU551_02050 [Candidatus Lokiarchaeota archaeon]